ncbi:hypothetical protein ONZ51_g8387 [Trametes cubensis]|uniref:Uncharacterized protein n=1 Tax=Trametes cubensis TaxID=1111947 RepID=A0AAD7X9A7_9APHY|nr:hypothetical protein ONZ51_g8387 [Trametes cubensis]
MDTSSQSHSEVEVPSLREATQTCAYQHLEEQPSLPPTEGVSLSHTAARHATVPAAATPLVHHSVLIRWVAHFAMVSRHLTLSEPHSTVLEHPAVLEQTAAEGGRAAGCASEDAQTWPLLQGDSYRRQSVSSNKLSSSSSVWRKKQNKAIARARERTRLLRRAYL